MKKTTSRNLHIPSCCCSHIFSCWVSSAAPAEGDRKRRVRQSRAVYLQNWRKHFRCSDTLYTQGLAEVKQWSAISWVSLTCLRRYWLSVKALRHNKTNVAFYCWPFQSGQPLHYINASDQNGCEGNKHLTGSNVSSHFNDCYPPHTKTWMALNMAAKLEMILCPYLYVSEINSAMCLPYDIICCFPILTISGWIFASETHKQKWAYTNK